MEAVLDFAPELALVALGAALATVSTLLGLGSRRDAAFVVLAGPLVVAVASWSAIAYRITADAAAARAALPQLTSSRISELVSRGHTGSAALALGITLSLGITSVVLARRVTSPPERAFSRGLVIVSLAVAAAVVIASLAPDAGFGSGPWHELACAPSWLGALFLVGLGAWVARGGRESVPLATAAIACGAGAVLAWSCFDGSLEHMTSRSSFPPAPAMRWADLDARWGAAVDHRHLASIALLPVVPALFALARRARLDWRPAVVVFAIVAMPVDLFERTIAEQLVVMRPTTIPGGMQPIDLRAPLIAHLQPVVPRLAITAEGVHSLEPTHDLRMLLADPDGVDVAIDARLRVVDLVDAVGASTGPVCIVGASRLPRAAQRRHPLLRTLAGGALACVALRPASPDGPIFRLERAEDLMALRAWATERGRARVDATLSVPSDLSIEILARAALVVWRPHVRVESR